jgi:hypothetical protein
VGRDAHGGRTAGLNAPGPTAAGRDEQYVRRAGTGLLPDGRRRTWSVAEGARGRRWRSTSSWPDGRFGGALLLEVDPHGRPARLELASPDGLLTLHPEPTDGKLHGNTVTPTGMRHHALPWSHGHLLVVAGSPVTGAIAAAALAHRVGVGEGRSVPVVEVGPGLGVRRATWRVARTTERRWRLVAADGGEVITVELDADGIAHGLVGAATWLLEDHRAR